MHTRASACERALRAHACAMHIASRVLAAIPDLAGNGKTLGRRRWAASRKPKRREHRQSAPSTHAASVNATSPPRLFLHLCSDVRAASKRPRKSRAFQRRPRPASTAGSPTTTRHGSSPRAGQRPSRSRARTRRSLRRPAAWMRVRGLAERLLAGKAARQWRGSGGRSTPLPVVAAQWSHVVIGACPMCRR